MPPMTLLRASRPNFLVLAPICAGLGIVLAWRQGVPLEPLDLTLVMAGALLAHAAVNLLNEYQDFRSGLLPVAAGLSLLPLPLASRVAAQLPRVLENPTGLSRILGINVATILATPVLLGLGLWMG